MFYLSRLNRVLVVLTLASTFAHAGETTNRIGITMVDIPSGSFLMGTSCTLTAAAKCSNPDTDANDTETPQHRVTVKAFQMGKTEVTIGQFKQFVAAAGRSDLANNDFMKYSALRDNGPMEQVSWNDAQDFIKWLNQSEGGGYRLPSEAEWEYACRAGGQHTYCGGNDLEALGWYAGNIHQEQSRLVGTKRANAFGLYDMSGSVWEWVQDCRNDSYLDSYRGAPSDGSAWMSGKCDKRGLRGGSREFSAGSSRATSRNLGTPDYRYNYSGFRLARTR